MINIIRGWKYEQAITAFAALDEYKDCDKQIENSQVAIAINEREYQVALTLFNEGKYEQAQSAFEQLGIYNDSKQMAGKCGLELWWENVDTKYNL